MIDILQAALSYAEMNRRVFPVHSTRIGIKTLEAALRICKRHGLVDPPGVAELLAASKRFAGTCKKPK